MQAVANPGTGLGPSFAWGRIHDAAKEDDLELLQDIVEGRNGAPVRDINIQSAGGLSALHVAAMSGSKKCLAYLLSRNAATHIEDSLRRLAIHWAADGGHTECITHLVSAGQEINYQDKDGNTALHLAARNGKVKAGKYLMLIGADLSVRNGRGWTPLEAATVPMYRTVMEMLEESLPLVNRVRRDHDRQRLKAFLVDCGMERYESNVVSAGYTAHYLLDSCRPIRLSKLNENCKNPVDKMNQRDYLLLLESIQSFQGTERYNPFAESIKRQKYFDENPEEHNRFLKENPTYEIDNADGSEYRRKILPKEKEFMEIMLSILNELRANDKQTLFEDILSKSLANQESLMFPNIENIVDSGWTDVKVMDFKQIERNIWDGMYQCWEQFQLDCFLVISVVWTYCRAAQSDVKPAFTAAVSLAMRAMRIFKKHNNSLKKSQTAFRQEAKEKMESLRRGWSKIAADKRLRGFLPDRFKERLLQADEDGDSNFKMLYSLRFDNLQEAFAHWGYRAKNIYETARFAWEEDERAARDHKFLIRMLHLTSSRDTARHFQHPVDDVRSDMHMPGGENTGPFTVQSFEREIVWPMDFSTMACRLSESVGPDHHILRPTDYVYLEQVQLDWLIIAFNCVIYHNKFHVEVKKAFDIQQRRPFFVPKAPCSLRLVDLEAFSCEIMWNQPDQQDSEEILAYEIEVATCTNELREPQQAFAATKLERSIRVEISTDGTGSDSLDASNLKVKLTKDRHSIATKTFGVLVIDNLRPCTIYQVYARSIGFGEISSPLSGSFLEFRTKPSVPGPATNLRALSTSIDNIIFTWDRPHDNGGGDVIDYELEYTDLKFDRSFLARVGWNINTLSTACVLREADSDSALNQKLSLPHKEDHLLPATSVKARIRARNTQGWGPWNTEGFCTVKTLSSTPTKPREVAVVAEGRDYIDIAWMPPLWSNCDEGVKGYLITVVYDDEDPPRKTTEFVNSTSLSRELSDGTFNRCPEMLSKELNPVRSTVKEKGLARSSINSSDSPLLGIEPGSQDFGGASNPSTPFGEKHRLSLRWDISRNAWWQNFELRGKVWFCKEVPTNVQKRISFDFPVVNSDKNVILFQEEGIFGWEQEKVVIIPEMIYEPFQLASRTQSVLQQTIPFTSSLRWNVFIQDGRFNFVLNRKFRLRMSRSLAYIYGLILDGDGWILSDAEGPTLQTHATSNQRSTLVATNIPQVETKLCDLRPIDCPYFHRIYLPSARQVSICVTAKNTLNQEEGIGVASESTSDSLHYRTMSQLPQPPQDIQANGILDSSIIVTWKKPTEVHASDITHTEVSYVLPNGIEELRRVPSMQEGININSLRPGQSVTQIRARSISRSGIGPYSSSTSATTRCCTPDPPYDFNFVSSTTNTITFAWRAPSFDGGTPIIEWELDGSYASGKCIKASITGVIATSFTFSNLEESANGLWLMDVCVRCRNQVGWSKFSNKENGRCLDSPWLFSDNRHARTDIKLQQQKEALQILVEAIETGHYAMTQAEDAARRPFRTKKAAMEAAENAVVVAEYSLLHALQKSEESGLKDLGVLQPPQDIEARKFLQSLQNKRARRWGASSRGQHI